MQRAVARQGGCDRLPRTMEMSQAVPADAPNTPPPRPCVQPRAARARSRQWLPLLVLAIVVGLGGWFRVSLIQTYRAPAGDGLNYFALSQELLRGGRYAYGPPPQALTYSRLPGYPLFLAHVAVRKAPLSLDQHLRQATRANVALDVGTALLVCLIAIKLGLSAWVGVLAAALLLSVPLSFVLTCYGLSEPLATFLSTLVLFLLLRARAHPRRALWLVAAAGALSGFAVLVRLDMVATLPASGLLLIWPGPPVRSRLRALAVFCGIALLSFAPWPLRNLWQFGAPHPEGSGFVAQHSGRVLPTGILRWASTWSAGAPGEGYFYIPVSRELPVPTSAILPSMVDSPEEKQQLLAIFAQHAKQGLSDEVNAAFLQLAEQRRRAHPLRTYITLPLRRLWTLVSPLPEYELPLRHPGFGLPASRQTLGFLEWSVYVLAAVGTGLLLLQRRLQLAALVVLVATRALLIPYAHPCPTQRYFHEAFPALCILAAFVVGEAARVVRRIGTAQRQPPPQPAAES